MSEQMQNTTAPPPPKPVALRPRFDTMPASLKARNQWVMWRYEWKEKPLAENGGKWDKPPLTTSGYAASTTNPAKWASFAQVVAAYKRGNFDGVGFVFTKADPVWGFDLDDKAGAGKWMDDANRQLTDAAMALLDPLDTYTELSPSGKGLHAYGMGELPGDKSREGQPDLELYGWGRYFTLTGWVIGGFPSDLQERQAQVTSLYDGLFPVIEKKPVKVAPRVGASGFVDAADLLKKAFANTKNGWKIEALFNGDLSAYGGDHSRADMALCSLLAFWSGGDAARLDGWFRQSRLYRPKWDEVHGAESYGDSTIAKALEGVSEFYAPKGSPEARAKAVARTASELAALPPARRVLPLAQRRSA